eukprot:6172148-Pleurochrysis_carterae.AAC.2
MSYAWHRNLAGHVSQRASSCFAGAGALDGAGGRHVLHGLRHGARHRHCDPPLRRDGHRARALRSRARRRQRARRRGLSAVSCARSRVWVSKQRSNVDTLPLASVIRAIHSVGRVVVGLWASGGHEPHRMSLFAAPMGMRCGKDVPAVCESRVVRSYATVALTLVTLFFGEILPKSLAVANAEGVRAPIGLKPPRMRRCACCACCPVCACARRLGAALPQDTRGVREARAAAQPCALWVFYHSWQPLVLHLSAA